MSIGYSILDVMWLVNLRKRCYGVNRLLVASGRNSINHNRAYWIMRQNNLLMARVTGSRHDKAHYGERAIFFALILTTEK